MSQIRIAKAIAQSGITSRRGAERLVEAGRVKCDGQVVPSVVFFVDDTSQITVDDIAIKNNSDDIKLWRFYKPVGYLTTRRDPAGRKTIFDIINLKHPRVLYIGRLDLNSEGLLLLTNNGPLARYFELPSSNIVRSYKVRAYGKINDQIIKQVKNGVTISGFAYGKIDIDILRTKGKNIWLQMTLTEGKNREIRKILDYFDLNVNRLIRTNYHTYNLNNLKPGDIEPIPSRDIPFQMI